MKNQNTFVMHTGKAVHNLQPGQPHNFKAKAGEHYRILRKAKTGEELLLDNVIAKRMGDDLVLNYADGTQVTLENFYGECRAGGCDITLAGQDADGYIINGETPSGVALGDGSTLAYVQGSHDTLMGMAHGNTALTSTLTGLKGAEIAYIPAASGIGSLGLLGVLGGGLGMATVGGGGVAAAAAVRNIVTVSVVAGPVVADNDLLLKLYQADGVTLIGEATVSLNGISTIDVGSYVGVILAKLNDTGSNPDYVDEATGLRVDLTGDLMAIGVANGGTIYLNLNVLTTLAAMKAGAIFSGASTAVITADVVTQTNAAVANTFGLTDLMGETVITTVDISGATNVNFTPETLTVAEKYGAVLAALSGADAANAGNAQTTINALFSGLTVTGTTATLSAAALEMIVAGAQTAAVIASGTGASSLTAIVSSSLVQENASVGIDRIATDGLISLSEKNSVITGTTVAGASVNLSIGGNTRAATVSGATWSYTLVDADITAMGQGGKTLSATATLATGGTASTTRSVVVDTIALAPVINAVATDDIINAAEVGSTITGSNEAGATVALSIGGNVRAASVSGTSWNYALVAADISAMGEGAETLSATQTDAAGNTSAAGTRSITVATTAPNLTVSGVAIASATGIANSTLNAGDVLSITVTMSEATTVDTTGGRPTLALLIGATTVEAAYTSGSGSTALVFSYTILANQTDTDGISIAANSLALNGGTLSGATNNAVTLTHTAVAANTGYLVDTLAPTNQDTVLAANVSKMATDAVTIVSSGDATGSVWLAPAGTTSFVASATMTTAGGTATSILAPATDGLYQLYVIDAAGNVSSASTNTLTVATSGARVTGIAIASATGMANNTLNAGDVLSVTVTMSEATTVDTIGGRPTLALLIGATTVQAAYASGSGSTALVFTCTILANQTDADGISIAANSLALNGGTLRDAAGNAVALTHTAAAANTGYLVDTVAPTNQDTVLAANVSTLGGGAVTIQSANEVNGSVWLAGFNPGTFNADPTIRTTASGTATSILAPTSVGLYRIYAIDAAGNVSAASTSSVTVVAVSHNNSEYSASTDTLVLTGQNYNVLLAAGESATTDIKARLDWSKLTWDINGDNSTTPDVAFAESDIASAKVSSSTTLTIVLASAKGTSLEATSGIAGATPDTLDIAAGFGRNLAGVAATTDARANASLSFTAPTNQNTVYASNLIKAPESAVAIVSTGDAANNVWFAPSGTSVFVAGDTMTTAGGTATSILAPKTTGQYKLYVIDAVGRVSSASLSGLSVPTTVDTMAPTVTNLSGAYSASTYTLTLTGTNYTTLIEMGMFENSNTNIKDRLDWSKLSWDINGDDDTTPNASFTLSDISSAMASSTTLTIVLTSAKGASLEATSGFAGATPDTLDIAAGFGRDLSGNAATTDAKANAGLSFTAPTFTYIQPIFSTNVNKGASSAVTIVSSGNAANSIWFAPAGTTNFVAGTTMTTAGGTATSILAPASDGAYKLYVLDVLGNASPASNGTLTVDAAAPTATITSGNYSASTNTLVLTGTNYNTLLESSLFESAATDIKARLDWSKLTWDINGDNSTTGDVSFAVGDITSAKVTNSTTLTIVLTSAKGASLEATAGFGGATLDTLDIAAGFAKDTWGNTATTDVVANAPLTFTGPTNQSSVFSSAATRKGAAAVTISSSGDATNSVWFAPDGTTSFAVGDTMTTAGGTATSILAPTTGGSYKLFVIDAAGARSAASAAGLTVDTTPPSVSGIAITTATGRLNNTLNAGDVVSVTVTMNEATTVVTTGGRPTLDLLIGETSVKAAYVSGTGTTALVFTYTILANQTDPDGISIAANSLALNGGTLSDAVGNAATTLTHTAVAANALYLVDNTAPTINSVAISSATGLQNNTLNVGDVVSVTLTMSEASTVTGSNARLMLNLNGNSVGAAYNSGNNSTALVFQYTIQAGDTDTNGISISANSLQLNGSTLSDLAGNNLVTPTFSAVTDNTGYLVDTTAPTNQNTVFPGAVIRGGGAAVTIVSADEVNGGVWFAPAGTSSFVAGATQTTAGGTATSILAPATSGVYKLYVLDAAGNVSSASNNTLTVDATAPTVSAIVINSATGIAFSKVNAGDVVTVRVTMNEVSTVETTGGTPTLALLIGTTTVQAAYASGSGSTELIFSYTILTGETDTDGISIAANSLALNGGTLTDGVGNAATTLTHAAVAANAGYLVDTTAPTNQDTLLPSNVLKKKNAYVTTGSFGEIDGTLWLAPDGTTSFVASATQTTIGSAATQIQVPQTSGEYKLYVRDAAGNVSSASTSTVTVDALVPSNQDTVFEASVLKKGSAAVTIVSAAEVNGSVWFAPANTTSFAAAVNQTTAGGTATSILAPALAGAYKLFVLDAAGNVSSASTSILTVDTTAPTNQNTVFAANATKKGAAAVTIVSSADATNTVWFAPEGTSSFVESASITTAASGTATTILAPATTGAYKLFVLDAAGNISTASTRTLTVDATAPTNQDTVFAANVPKKGGAAVTIVSSGDVGNTVWFAPEGTSSFVAGTTMTTAGGTATSILTPASEGAYKLFVLDAVGNVSSASTSTLTVDNVAPINQDTVFAANVPKKGGAAVTIESSGDATNTVWFAPANNTIFVAGGGNKTTAGGTATSILAPTSQGTYKLYVLDAAGNFSIASSSTLTVDNTPPNNQDSVFAANATRKGAAAVTIVSSADANNSVWFAPVGTTSFVAGPTMTTADGTATSILTPTTEGAYKLFLLDAVGNISSPSTNTLTVDTTAPINQNTVFAADALKKAAVSVTIVSSGDANNSVWLAPEGTTSFATGPTMTKAVSGTSNTILTPATDGAYKLFVVDLAGNISNASTSTLKVDNTAPTATNTSGAYTSSTDTLVLTGTNYSTMLETGESATTDIKSRLDWTKLSWGAKKDNGTQTTVSFALGDISSANVTDGTTLTIALTSAKGSALEATSGYGGTTLDKLTINSGFVRDAAGNMATTDAANEAALSVSAPVAGDRVIDLNASYGQLIAPVQVEGNWYYFWDRSGNGTSAGGDAVTHDVLDGLFTKDILGNTGGSGNTTDVYRYATLNGVHVALPTINGGVSYPDGSQTGTSYADALATSNGSTSSFNELLAIWDAYNGAGTGTGDIGAPAGWQNDRYWSATPSASVSFHDTLLLSVGSVSGTADLNTHYVALQVL